jgi:hypothetical protein
MATANNVTYPAISQNDNADINAEISSAMRRYSRSQNITANVLAVAELLMLVVLLRRWWRGK